MHHHGRVTPTKQEQEPASPEVTELAPGVLRSQLPIDMPGLGHVNCYLLEDERGVALVDPGLPEQTSYDAIVDRLSQAGIPLRRVHTVVVTHSHPDHFGGAGWLRDQTGAEIVTHRWFPRRWDPSEPPDLDIEDLSDPELGAPGRPRRLRPWDAPPWGGEPDSTFTDAKERFGTMMRTTTPTVSLDDAQQTQLAGREWIAVHTPGHTDDHVCLFDPVEGLMIAGDHVLPSITPHISGVARAVDPLAEFFASLDKVASYGPQVTQVLPAHGHPFADLAERAGAIKEHHVGRLQRLRDASVDMGRPATVPEMSTYLFSARAQGRMADSETFAHVEHLCRLGEMDRHDGPDGWFRYVLS